MVAYVAAARVIRIRRPGMCAVCATSLVRGEADQWGRRARALTATAGAAGSGATAPPELERGTAGSSASRRYRSLHDRRERRVRTQHPRIGGLILRATNEPASTRVWAIGSEGERLIGAGLDAIDERIAITLHDRRIPRSRANIDHITIARSGVFVIDSKRYSGRLELRQAGPLWMRERRLYIGGRDKTKFVEGMAKQTAAVREAIQPLLEEFELPLTPVLCFLGVDVPLLARPFEINGVRIEWPRPLKKRLEQAGPLAPAELRLFARNLATALPPA